MCVFVRVLLIGQKKWTHSPFRSITRPHTLVSDVFSGSSHNFACGYVVCAMRGPIVHFVIITGGGADVLKQIARQTKKPES